MTRYTLVEARTTLRRLARRRTVAVVLALDLGVAAYGSLVAPFARTGPALASAAALGAFTLLVLSAGLVADDRAAGRLAIAATQPAARADLVVGRWLAVTAGALAVTVGTGVALAAGPGFGAAGGFALALAAAAAHLAALGALAILLSCVAGPTAQVLLLLGVQLAGVMPPALAAQALPWEVLRPAAHALWLMLPTPWLLDRVQSWALGLEAAAPLLLVVLLAQTPVGLVAATRALDRAELGIRSE